MEKKPQTDGNPLKPCVLFGASACRAGVVVPPAYGPGKLVKRLVFFAVVLLLVAPVEAEPAVLVVGAVALRLLRGGGSERRRCA